MLLYRKNSNLDFTLQFNMFVYNPQQSNADNNINTN